MKFKTEAGLEHSDITGFPTLNEMTICFWINLHEYPASVGGKQVKILDYVNKNAAHVLFRISVEVEEAVRIFFFIDEKG